MSYRERIRAAKESLRIGELWRRLDLPGRPAKSCHSPLREDSNPSFSVYDDGLRWKDFATGEHGDAIDLLAKARQITNREAAPQFLQLAGTAYTPSQIKRPEAKPAPRKPKPDLSALHEGPARQRSELAQGRHLDTEAISIAEDMGLLRFGAVCGYPSWIITDCSGICAEGRRLDGEPYPAIGDLAERKAHTLKNSSKNSPVGILPAPEYRDERVPIALVEGGPDLLAAIHFGLRYFRPDVMPVAILGREAARRGLHPESLPIFRGHRVRIYPHDDSDGGSYTSALIWGRQLQQLGCTVDFFNFKNLRTDAGTAVKDLNDCALLAPESRAELEDLFP